MISTVEMIGRLLLATTLGSVIGWERERRAWTAGLRTHMMVSLGAALIMLVSEFGFQDVVASKGIVLDPSRVAAQVVSGIGFLGAGTILFLRNEVIKGLTTAAGLWTVAAIGLAVGGGLYIPAVAGTAFAILILIVFKPLEDRYFSKNRNRTLKLIVALHDIKLVEIESILRKYQIAIQEVSLSSLLDKQEHEMLFKVRGHIIKEGKILTVIEDLEKIKGVEAVEFMA